MAAINPRYQIGEWVIYVADTSGPGPLIGTKYGMGKIIYISDVFYLLEARQMNGKVATVRIFPQQITSRINYKGDD